MTKGKYSTELVEFNNGINIDCNPLDQPRGSRRFTLNTVERSSDGQTNLANEPSNISSTTFPDGYLPIGDRYVGSGNTFVILVNPDTNRQDLGVVDIKDVYASIVNTNTLNCKITKQCDIRFRVRRGNERVVYWVDGDNNARTFNLDRPYNFYNTTYQDYLRAGGDPDAYTDEKWDSQAFDLIKTYSSVPTFNSLEVLDYGAILPGSYNFAIQLVDDDLNPTNWITTSNTVNIYNDSLDLPFEKIRGSRNIETTAQSWPRAPKTIKFVVSNLDTSFPYYRIAIIRAAGNTGDVEKVLLSDLNSTSESTYLYSGNDTELIEGKLGDILIDKQILYSPDHIEQQENRLLLASNKGKMINWCDFQQYASKIKSDLVTKEVILNSVFSDPNVKNGRSTFLYRGYMPGEVYSFTVAYLFDDGYISPAFHIPGRNVNDTNSQMMYHELDTKYLDVHNCSIGNYWGLDFLDETLVGKNIRHHRFPFRKEANKPLVTTTTNETTIDKFKLSIVISLNPSHTPTAEYPVDDDGNPLAISYQFKYTVEGTSTEVIFSGTLVDTDVTGARQIVLYDDTVALDQAYATGTAYQELDLSSELGSYQDGMNDVFVITESYDEYTLATVINTDSSEIFGIEFSNIERPHPNVVGVYILRAERQDADRIVVDNAIFGAVTESANYKSFGLVMPRQYYDISDSCGGDAESGKEVVYSDDTLWFFNPEYQYLQRKLDFDDTKIEGIYTQTEVDIPTISDTEGSECNSGGSKGVHIQDVQAGTSYDPELNKSKDSDDDGFDLLVGYRNSTVEYAATDTNLVLPAPARAMYLTATAYQNFDDAVYYNTSVDNKIGMMIADEEFDTDLVYDDSTDTNKLLYGSLIKQNTTSYSNFMNRTYYKEHNNPILFGDRDIINDVEIYNGDAQISSFNFVSTVFYDMVVADREKKSQLWKIITGGILIAIGIVLAIPTAGASLGLTVIAATALAGLAISYGVSLAVSGIKFEQFKNMTEVDYEKGLKDCVSDGTTFECIRENIETDDDTIRWFADRVSNIYMETTVPFGLRSGLTCGVPDFIDSPSIYNEEEFRSYLTEKLTTIDREQGAGRLYKGYASAEVYDMNLDYMRFNHEKEFIHLPIEYDCCSDFNETYPRRIWRSEQSFQEEKVDNYRAFLPNNYIDIEGEHGGITGMYRLGNSLFIQTEEGLWQLVQNHQERITNEIVSFIGTGDPFSILPRKVVDSDLGTSGTMHKWANQKTAVGVFSINERDHKITLHTDKLNDISSEGTRAFFYDSIRSFLHDQLYNQYGIYFVNTNNPANPNGTGYISVYDSKYERVIFTKKDYLLLPDKIDSLDIVDIKSVTNEGTDVIYGFNGLLAFFDVNYSDQGFRDAIEDLELEMIRYPGGGIVETFNPETGLDFDGTGTPNTIEDLALLVAQTGCKVMFVMNMVTSTMEDQIAMLDRAKALQIPITHIELANEVNNLGTLARNTVFPDVSDYIAACKIWSQELRDRYERVKLYVVGENKGHDPDTRTWMTSIDEIEADGKVYHCYPNPNEFADEDGIVDLVALEAVIVADMIETGFDQEATFAVTECNLKDSDKDGDTAYVTPEQRVVAIEFIVNFLVSKGANIILLHNIVGKVGALEIDDDGSFIVLPTGIAFKDIIAQQGAGAEALSAIGGTSDFVFNLDDGKFYQGSEVVPLTNKDYFEDKSWTISYSLKTRKWVSWHSYLPNYYLHAKDRLLSYIAGANDLWKHNVDGSYGMFYGIQCSHILEGVKVFGKETIVEDLTLETKALLYSSGTKQYIDKRYITFNKITLYNDTQSSGELGMEVKEENVNKQNWISQQTAYTPGYIKITRPNREWNLNGFRDFVTDYDDSLFSSDWEDMKDGYYMDKVVNTQAVSFTKDWKDLQNFRGKYIIFRLKFDNFEQVNLITNFLFSTVQTSE